MLLFKVPYVDTLPFMSLGSVASCSYALRSLMSLSLILIYEG